MSFVTSFGDRGEPDELEEELLEDADEDDPPAAV
jgi:hypothetical protein